MSMRAVVAWRMELAMVRMTAMKIEMMVVTMEMIRACLREFTLMG